MDPLSLTASIIAVIGAADKAGKGLKELMALRHAPDILLQFNNEVADVQLILHTVESRHQNDNHTTINEHEHEHEHELMCNALEKVKKALLELEQLIAYSLTKVTSSGNTVDYIVWLRSKKKIQQVREKIRSAKNDLQLATSIMSS